MTGPKDVDAAPATVLADKASVPIDASARAPLPSVFAIPDAQHNVRARIERGTQADPSKFPSPQTHVCCYIMASYDQGTSWEFTGAMYTTAGGVDPDSAYSQTQEVSLKRLPGRLIRVHYVPICGPSATLESTVTVV